tara:strand:- start:130 stop:549 length:420 start_codon:yes stop_codon:yes gene_type:complete
MAIATSKIGNIKNNLITRFHFSNRKEKFKYKQITSKLFTKFHRDFYQEHLLELASDLSSDEQEVAAEILAEPDIEITNEISEEDHILVLEDLTKSDNESTDLLNLPVNSRVINIIVRNGNIIEKTYLNSEYEKTVISFV